jgi:putative FmdB family regulatory protein
MPLYEYLCSDCGKRFEKLQKTEEKVKVECPACGSDAVLKQMSSFASGNSSTAACYSGG